MRRIFKPKLHDNHVKLAMQCLAEEGIPHMVCSLPTTNF